VQGEDFSANISRARFEEINAAMFKSTIDPVEKVLKDSKIPRDKVRCCALLFCLCPTVIF
jgi:heat shock protein 1/8